MISRNPKDYLQQLIEEENQPNPALLFSPAHNSSFKTYLKSASQFKDQPNIIEVINSYHTTELTVNDYKLIAKFIAEFINFFTQLHPAIKKELPKYLSSAIIENLKFENSAEKSVFLNFIPQLKNILPEKILADLAETCVSKLKSAAFLYFEYRNAALALHEILSDESFDTLFKLLLREISVQTYASEPNHQLLGKIIRYRLQNSPNMINELIAAIKAPKIFYKIKLNEFFYLLKNIRDEKQKFIIFDDYLPYLKEYTYFDSQFIINLHHNLSPTFLENYINRLIEENRFIELGKIHEVITPEKEKIIVRKYLNYLLETQYLSIPEADKNHTAMLKFKRSFNHSLCEEFVGGCLKSLNNPANVSSPLFRRRLLLMSELIPQVHYAAVMTHYVQMVEENLPFSDLACAALINNLQYGALHYSAMDNPNKKPDELQQRCAAAILGYLKTNIPFSPEIQESVPKLVNLPDGPHWSSLINAILKEASTYRDAIYPSTVLPLAGAIPKTFVDLIVKAMCNEIMVYPDRTNFQILAALNGISSVTSINQIDSCIKNYLTNVDNLASLILSYESPSILNSICKLANKIHDDQFQQNIWSYLDTLITQTLGLAGKSTQNDMIFKSMLSIDNTQYPEGLIKNALLAINTNPPLSNALAFIIEIHSKISIDRRITLLDSCIIAAIKHPALRNQMFERFEEMFMTYPENFRGVIVSSLLKEFSNSFLPDAKNFIYSLINTSLPYLGNTTRMELINKLPIDHSVQNKLFVLTVLELNSQKLGLEPEPVAEEKAGIRMTI